MTEKTVIYSKRSGEPPVPVTVRLEWMSDGSIRPCLYWTPDGSCYQVMPDFKCVRIAFLKERGAGLRFEVNVNVVHSSDPDNKLPHTRNETYLYLADDWFCGENFVDARYGHAGKEFISVMMDVFPNCGYELVYFTAQGVRYAVKKTLAVEPRGSSCAGGTGVWHKVEARHVNAYNDEDPNPGLSILRHAAVYFEVNKWFVAVKEYETELTVNGENRSALRHGQVLCVG